MHSQAGLSIQRRLKASSIFCVVVMSLLALLALAGWVCDIGIFRRPIADLPAMNPTTAVAFLLSGLSFLTLTYPKQQRRIRTIGLVLASAVTLIGLLRLVNLFFPQLPACDELLFTTQMQKEAAAGLLVRMAANTAICFVLSGAALWSLQDRNSANRHLAFPELSIGLISLLSLLGHIYRVNEFYGVLRYLPMSLTTAVAFLFLSLACLFAVPERGIMHILTGSLPGSLMARRLFPFLLIVPIIFGWLRLYAGWSLHFGVEFGVSILVLSIIIFLAGIVFFNARQMNRRALQSIQTETRLRESERKYMVLVDNIQDYAIFMLDPEGHIMSWNQGAQAIKGYTEEEVIGRHLSIFYTEEEIVQGEPAFNLTMAEKQGRYHHTGWRVRKDGTRFWADIVFTALFNEDHLLQGFAKVTRDMTERKMAEEKISYQLRLMEDITDAIFSTDLSYRVVTWNKGAEVLYGYTAREAIGAAAAELLGDPSETKLRQFRRNELEEKGFWTGEVTLRHKNGTILRLLLTVSAVHDREGRPEGYVTVCRDITYLKLAEEQLRKFNEDLAGQVREKTDELASVLERLSEGFMSIAPDGRILYVNHRAAEMNRRSIGDLVDRNFWEEFPTAKNNEFAEHFYEAMAFQENHRFEMYSPSLRMWIECAMYPSPKEMSFFFRDITEQTIAREAVARSNTELRALASHLQDIREEERAVMAREVHDELGQQLTGLKMDLSWIARKLPEVENDPVRQRMQGTLELMNHTIQTVRKIATELRPSILDDLGLIAAIEWQSQEFEKRSGIKTCFHPEMDELDCSPVMKIGLFRICQESLTNVARHSGAGKVEITLCRGTGSIVLKIVDDGVGLPQQDDTTPRKTLGLLGMRERAMMMGGHIDIHNEPGKGLALSVTVPLTITDR